MPGLSDIPDHLRDPNFKLEFLMWLTQLPISIYEARATMKVWASATGRTFTGNEWDSVERSFRRKNG